MVLGAIHSAYIMFLCGILFVCLDENKDSARFKSYVFMGHGVDPHVFLSYVHALQSSGVFGAFLFIKCASIADVFLVVPQKDLVETLQNRTRKLIFPYQTIWGKILV